MVSAPVDLRLVVAAGGAWLATLAALGMHAPVGYALGTACEVVALAALLARRPWSAVAVMLLGCAGAAFLATAVRVHARDGSPVARLAGHRATATVDLVVRDDPRQLSARAPGGGPRVAVSAQVERVASDGQRWVVSGELVVLAPAEGWQQLLPSQRLRAEGQLMPARRGDLSVAVLSARGAPRAVQPPSWGQRAAAGIRRGLQEAASVLPERSAGLLPGLVVGDTSRLDPVLAADFSTVGLTHLVAVSGTNCAIVAGAVLVLLRGLTAGPRLSAVVGALALVGFVVLARPSPSVLRAAVMGGVALVVLAAGRSRAALPALSLSVLVLVMARPALAAEPGFALSVLATGALLLVAPGWSSRLQHRGVPRVVADAVAVPAAAHLATAPVVVALSGQLSLVAIAANILAVPAVAPATVLGVLTAVIAPVAPAAARVLARCTGLPIGWLVVVAERGARLPAAAVPWPAGLAGATALIVTLAATLRLARFPAVRKVAAAGAAGALVIALPARVAVPGWPPPGWIFVACDVGQGDALVVRAGPGAAVVVDAGPDPVLVDGCLRRLAVARVPLVVLTHLHNDHVAGLAGVLSGRTVGTLEVGPLHVPQAAWRSVREAAARRGLRLVQAAVGEVRAVGDVRLEVLAPRAAFHGTRSDPNNSSVLLRVTTHGHSLLLAGDAEVEAQDAVLAAGIDLRAEVLKVAHHGSAWQSPHFLAAVHPALAVVSVGADNDYGHPSPLVLAELARMGARVLRTDRDKDVAVCVVGERLMVASRARGPPYRAPARAGRTVLSAGRAWIAP